MLSVSRMKFKRSTVRCNVSTQVLITSLFVFYSFPGFQTHRDVPNDPSGAYRSGQSKNSRLLTGRQQHRHAGKRFCHLRLSKTEFVRYVILKADFVSYVFSKTDFVSYDSSLRQTLSVTSFIRLTLSFSFCLRQTFPVKCSLREAFLRKTLSVKSSLR